MTRRILVSGAVVGVVALLVSAVAIKGQQPGGRTGTLNVMVSDAEGLPVRGLAAQDFALTIDGAPVDIDDVEAPPPLTIVALLDVTPSAMTFAWREAETILSLEQTFLPELDPRDRMRIGTIARRPSLTSEFTGDRQLILAGVRQALSAPDDGRLGPSPIWDAVDMAAGVLAAEPGWLNILLVTDGLASGNRVGLDDAIGRAIAAGAAVHIVEASIFQLDVLKADQDTVIELVRSRSPLERLASLTGGLRLTGSFLAPRVVHDPAPSLGECFRQIVGALRAGYSLRFREPVATDHARAIDVRVRGRENLRVHTRRSYGAPSTSASPSTSTATPIASLRSLE